MLQPLPVHSVGPVAVRIPPSNLDKSNKFGSNFYVIFVLYYLLLFFVACWVLLCLVQFLQYRAKWSADNTCKMTGLCWVVLKLLVKSISLWLSFVSVLHSWHILRSSPRLCWICPAEWIHFTSCCRSSVDKWSSFKLNRIFIHNYNTIRDAMLTCTQKLT